MTRIDDKIDEINELLDELQSIVPDSVEEYTANKEKKAACERYIERIVEAATDLAFFVIKGKKLRIPQDDSDAFAVLLENKIIDDALTAKLRNAKGMRNIIAHQYGKIDDGVVFAALTEELERDALKFIRAVRNVCKKGKS